MIFEIQAERLGGEEGKQTFYYDNIENILKRDDGTVYEFTNIQETHTLNNTLVSMLITLSANLITFVI